MSGIKFRKWISEAADGLLTPEQSREFKMRFLRAAANDCGGERVSVPSLVSARTKAMRAAQKLIDIGASLDECRAIVGPDFCRSTYYDWRKKAEESKGVVRHLKRKHIEGAWHGSVYSLQFEGPGGECLFKIGKSFNPWTRAQTICAMTDLTLVGAAVVRLGDRPDGSYATDFHVEQATHRALGEFRVEGEWFDLPGGMEQAIDAAVKCGTELFGRVYVNRA